MPLLDHFHPPLSDTYDWHSFYSNWATRLADGITPLLPLEFIAAEQTRRNGLEIDFANVPPSAWAPFRRGSYDACRLP